MLLELEAAETGMGLRQILAARMLVLIVMRTARAGAKLARCVHLLGTQQIVLTITFGKVSTFSVSRGCVVV